MKVQGVSTLITQELETIVQDCNQAIDPTIDLINIVYRFHIFAVCVNFSSQSATITQRFEQFTTASTIRFYHTIHYLTVTDPSSSLLEDIHQRYHQAFPHKIGFTGLPSQHIIAMIDTRIRQEWDPCTVWHNDNRPSEEEHAQFAQDIAELVQVEYQLEPKVPKWVLDFAITSLSLDPLPSASILANCFEVLAINLGYNALGDTTSSKG